MQSDLVNRLRKAVPLALDWIDGKLQEYAGIARPVSTLPYSRLATCFPADLLEHTKSVTVTSVPFPPVGRLGLPELAPLEQMAFVGITYRETILVRQDSASENLHFHELVHVVQWRTLGAENFLLAYGLGLFQYGYEASPLEAMAYSLQRSFESARDLHYLVPHIEAESDAIWRRAAPLVGHGDT